MLHSHFTMCLLKWVLIRVRMYKDSESECVCVFLWLFFFSFFFFYLSFEAEINNNTCNSNKPWIHSTVRHTLLKTCLKYPQISCYGTHHPLKLHEQGSRAPPAPHLQARKTDLLLTESRGTLRFAWMAQPYYLFIFFCAAGEAAPSHRASKPVSGPSPSPAGWPSPQTWWSSMAILTGWWSAWRCCSGWWGWRGARGPQGPEGGSCRTIRPACSDLAAPERTGARLHRDRVEWEG